MLDAVVCCLRAATAAPRPRRWTFLTQSSRLLRRCCDRTTPSSTAQHHNTTSTSHPARPHADPIEIPATLVSCFAALAIEHATTAHLPSTTQAAYIFDSGLACRTRQDTTTHEKSLPTKFTPRHARARLGLHCEKKIATRPAGQSNTYSSTWRTSSAIAGRFQLSRLPAEFLLSCNHCRRSPALSRPGCLRK